MTKNDESVQKIGDRVDEMHTRLDHTNDYLNDKFDNRTDQMLNQMNRKYESVITNMHWTIGIAFTLMGILVSVLEILLK